ncbi:hypothetical protein AVEN_56238-1 [Araneus ventricosus]|uniref:Uncharacterized protein n=1 Tax=Araneus ventricosus TaxID=182803 RepID=A0A4Y2SJR9_ARAVE|nr:hypothetical protein AVEN_56238-1 [Araneus ventricosus]
MRGMQRESTVIVKKIRTRDFDESPLRKYMRKFREDHSHWLLDGYVPRHSTLKGTRRKTENNNTRHVHRRSRERGIMGKNATYHKKEKAVNCNRYKFN